MAHHSLKSGYQSLVERLNRFPQGAPPSDLLYEILKILFTEKEAALVSLLPIKPFTAASAARAWNLTEAEARKILDTLASRAILLDVENAAGESEYVLPPPMAGFLEFSLMRVRGDIDQRLLSELLYQYLNVEEDFVKALFTTGETQLGRIFVQERSLPQENDLHVLDYERASEVIKTASHIGIGVCYCRHKMTHLDRACKAPLDICMTFNNTASSLIKNNFARAVDAAECIDVLEKAQGFNLVQFGENVQNRVNFICNCCGCCCEALIVARKFGFLHPVHTTNYLPRIDTENCSGCGKCVSICPVKALSIMPGEGDAKAEAKKVLLNEDQCLGCGVCVRNCPKGGIKLDARAQRVITPVNSAHRVVMMAIERGKLQDLIFDNRLLWSHRAMAAVLGVILRMPPLKQLMASRQIKSRYLGTLALKRSG